MGMHYHIKGSAEQHVIDRMEAAWRLELLEQLVALLQRRVEGPLTVEA